jgi:tRNA-(ms[2]io[6]A)-hydroxylase
VKNLLRYVKSPAAMVDKLIVGAFIEAITCERFAKIAAHVDKKLGDFYIYLLH